MSRVTASRAIVQEANEWLVRLNDPECTASEQAVFGVWLRQSPVHVREYLRAEGVWLAMAGVDAGKRIDVAALLKGGKDNVVPIADRGVQATDDDEPPVRTRRWLFGAAAAVALTLGGSIWYWEMSDTVRYVAGLGEQRRLVLDDGSVVELNTQTELTVHMDETGRYVTLERGEALFTVAKDAERPFMVDGELATVRALGTQFNVYRQADQVSVTVIEGRVAVKKRGSTRIDRSERDEASTIERDSVELAAGYQATIAARRPIRKTVVKIESAAAWREGRLIFDDQPLTEVVREFNRYNRRQLIISDPDLVDFRISAVFDADQPEALVRFLEQSTTKSELTEDNRLVIRLED